MDIFDDIFNESDDMIDESEYDEYEDESIYESDYDDYNDDMIYEDDEDLDMDVQVGPNEEIEASPVMSPIDIAKADPKNVPIGCKQFEDGMCEFYVDADDIVKLAKLNEVSILEAMNAVIESHSESEISAQNTIMVMSESTLGYVGSLERNGVNCIRFVDEADDIQLDVQVGPHEDEIKVAEDPQTANPLDVVKKSYDSVVVAKDGNKFFTDVEDVQKCAELNCESVIDTLNGIIEANADAGMSADNCVVHITENITEETLREFHDAEVLCEARFQPFA